MRKSNFKILALTAALIMPLSSCKETIIYVTPEDIPNDDIKTPIELSVGGVDGAVESSSTRAVITDGNSKTLKPFDVNTKIFMVMKSEYGTTDFNDPDYPHVAKYTVARGDVAANSNDNDIVFDSKNQRYWDDAHARSSQLDIWAYAQKGQSWTDCTFEVPNANGTGLDAYKDQPYHTANTPSPVWTKGTTGEIYPAIRTWRASHYITSTASNYRCQDATTVMCQDLLFSNNLTNNQTYNETGGDKRLKFDFSARKFPQVGEARMIFYHAMSKITIHIKKGDGFTSSDPFAFSTTGNVKLMGFNTEGLFNLKTGQFEYIWQHYDIPSIYKWATAASGDAYTLEALVIPNVAGNATGLTDEYSKLGEESDAVSMEFTIDNSNYKLKQKDLFKAIKDKTANNISDDATEIKLEAGKNYIFTFVVGKTKIEHLTATVAEWEDVEAESYTPIIDVNQTYGDKESESDLNKTYTLLRSTTKAGSYGNGSCSDGNSAKMEYNTTDSKYNAMAPQLYWPDHKTHYFFRGVYPEVKTSVTTGYPTIDTEGKTISVTNSAYTKETSPSDLMIGIPRKSNGDPDEKCKVTGTNHGSDVAGICATSGNINLNFRYAMSQVEVRLSTVTGDATINLTNAKVEVVGGYKQGKIKLEDGGVASFASSDKGDFELAVLPSTDTNNRKDKNGDNNIVPTYVRHSSVIPQDLTYNSSKPLDASNLRFKITITNTDGSTDVYYADIKPIEVTVGSNNKSTITKWEAGKHYIYFLELKKTEIKVSATITDWVTATGSTNVWF